jgi:YYY domain-containing protein
VRAAADNRKRWYLLFGLFTGLAMASRINVAPVALLIGLSGLIWLTGRGTDRIAAWGDLRLPASRNRVALVLLHGILAALMTLLTFRLAMPYAFSDNAIARDTVREKRQERSGRLVTLEEVSRWHPEVLVRSVLAFNPRWIANMEEIQRLQEPEAMFPPAVQWVDRTPLLMPWSNMVLYGMGLAAGLAAWGGLAWALWRIGRSRPDWPLLLIPVAWSSGYFLFMGIRWVKSVRYFLPIYPALLLLAAWALLTLWQKAAPRPRPWRIAAGATLGGVLLFTLLWANSFTRAVYREPFTRIAASEWMLENIPSGVSLLTTPPAHTPDGTPRSVHLPVRNHLFQTGGTPLNTLFELPESADLVALRFNALTDEQTSPDPLRFRVRLTRADDGSEVATIESGVQLSAPRTTATIPLGGQTLDAGVAYWLTVEQTSGGVVIADTSAILNESWDDALPTRTAKADPFGNYVRGVRDDILGFDGQAPLPNADDPNKQQGFGRWLDSADVIAISSQRALWSTPRIPLTFPVTIRYYEALFNGELGFDLAAQFHAPWRIGPLHISDTGGRIGWGSPPQIGWPPPSDFWSAEEAFSVYDHPPVWIFTKRADYDPLQVRSVLNSVDMGQAVFMNPRQATDAPTGLMLDSADFSRHLAGGTFRNLFNPDGLLNRTPALAAVVWWLAVVAIGWLAFPLTFAILPALPGRGYPLARILGLLIVSYFGWITASVGLLPNTAGTYWLGLLVLVAVSAGAWWLKSAEIGSFLRTHRQYLLLIEGIALLLFLLGLVIRLGNPDVWDVIWGGEKPMDLTYFTAVLKSSSFPPYDPWYAGGMLNYYYYGFVFVGVLPKLFGIAPTVAYNLAIPMLFSFTGLAAFSLAYDLTAWGGKKSADDDRAGRLAPSPVLAGSMALLLTVLIGNLAQIQVILKAWHLAGDPALSERIPFFGNLLRAINGAISLIGPARAPMHTGDWFWSASRAISVPPGEIGPITEFPFFTFLYGDLHAHMIALPLTLLALGWVIALGLQEKGQPGHPALLVLTWLIGALTIGVLFPTNSWDYPTFTVLALLGITLRALRRDNRLTLALIVQVAVQGGGLALLAWLLFQPFHANFAAGYSEVALWKGAKTGLGSALSIHALFLLITVVHLLRELRAWAASLSAETLEQGEWLYTLLLFALIGGGFLTLALAWWFGAPIIPLMVPLVVVAGALALSARLPAPRRIVLALISSAWALTLFVDIFVIEGTVGRMNTVFKFYMQVWLLLSVTGGVALARIQAGGANWDHSRKIAWRVAFGLLLFGALLYPPTATRAKWDVRMGQDAPRTLDGMAFMPYVQYEERGQTVSLAPDYAALRWMQRHIDGSPVVAEATSDNYYRSIGSRVTMYTGLPTIIGWSGHQRQQRNAVPNARIDDRIQDVTVLYTDPDFVRALEIIGRYQVGYVYVGPLERLYYADIGLQKFPLMAEAGLLELVYDHDGVQIYRVLPVTPAG